MDGRVSARYRRASCHLLWTGELPLAMDGRVATRPYILPRFAWHCGFATHTRLGSLPPDPTILRIVCFALYERCCRAPLAWMLCGCIDEGGGLVGKVLA